MKAAMIVGVDTLAVRADPMSRLPVVVVEHGRATWTTDEWVEIRQARPAVVVSEGDASALAAAFGVDVDTVRKGLQTLIGRAR